MQLGLSCFEQAATPRGDRACPPLKPQFFSDPGISTWTPKVCKRMAQNYKQLPEKPCVYIFLGSRQGCKIRLNKLVCCLVVLWGGYRGWVDGLGTVDGFGGLGVMLDSTRFRGFEGSSGAKGEAIRGP